MEEGVAVRFIIMNHGDGANVVSIVLCDVWAGGFSGAWGNAEYGVEGGAMCQFLWNNFREAKKCGRVHEESSMI